MGILTDIEVDFLRASDALAGIFDVDYENARHAEAWLHFKTLALERAPLTVSDMGTACALLGVGAADLDGLVDALAADVAAPSPARDFYGGHTMFLAGRYLYRFGAVDGRLARLVANYVLLRKNWPLVVFRDECAATSEAEAGAWLLQRVRENASCGSCRVGRVERVKHGVEVDTYRCTGCGVEFKLDWKGLIAAFRAACAPM